MRVLTWISWEDWSSNMKGPVGVGFLQIGRDKRYTVSFPFDERGKKTHIHIRPYELEVLKLTRHPSIRKVEDFLNSEDGLKLLEDKVGYEIRFEFKRCWNCKYGPERHRSVKVCADCCCYGHHVLKWY